MQIEFGFVEALGFGVGRCFQLRSGYLGRCGIGRGRFQIDESAEQIRIGTSGFELTNLILAGDVCDTALFDDANESATGNTRREPSHQLDRGDGLAFTGLGSEGHPKKKEKN